MFNTLLIVKTIFQETFAEVSDWYQGSGLGRGAMELDLGAPRSLGAPRGRANRRHEYGPALTGGAKGIPPAVCRAGGLEEQKKPRTTAGSKNLIIIISEKEKMSIP